MRNLLALLVFAVASTTALAEEAGQDVTFDGLERVEDARVGVAYIDPDADFSVFRRVAILDPYVAFRANWQRDQNRNRSRNIRSADMERIKADVASLFRDVFTERLEAAGFEIVNVANEDVLILRPAIIDLDITAPDTQRAGRSRTFAASTGAATLYLQLVDSLSGAAIGRAIDRQAARRAGGTVGWSNRVTNRAEARRVVVRWADILVEFLATHYYSPDARSDDTETVND
ncbi:MAG: DUF3313 family protein [Gammaproteobacteria bacterium]